jgi:predicted Zn-dependent protease
LFLGLQAFGGLAYLEGRSLLSGRLGKKLFSRHLTLSDDAYHPMSVGIPFDFEGSPRRAVKLVDRGVVQAVVHDRRTARRAATRSTGHALPLPNAYGPLPVNLVMAAGRSQPQELVAGTRRGLLITRFHYTNVLDPKTLTLTGMTRFGTFLIENGKLGPAVQNMRFTDSMERVLGSVEGVTRTRRFCGSFFGGGYVVPGVKLGRLAFTSGTDF